MRFSPGRSLLKPRRRSDTGDPAMAEALRVATADWGELTDWSIHPRALAGLPLLVGDLGLLIVECGSGFSTTVLHGWAQRRRGQTRIVSYEHQPEQLSRLRAGTDPTVMAHVCPSPLSQITEGSFRRMLSCPAEAPAIWRDRADPLPEDLYQQTRISRVFYDRLMEASPQLLPDERLLVILDGPNGSGRSIAFPLFASVTNDESFWMIDDWDHYPFLQEMAQLFVIVEEQTGCQGNKRWKLLRARPRAR